MSFIYQPVSSLKITDSIYKTKISGLLYIKRPKHYDHRGFFTEVVNIPELEKILGYDFDIRQINHAQSKEKTARGLHIENWNKLVTITSGVAYCVLVDTRPESKTFKQIEYIKMDASYKNGTGALYLEKGIANSYCVLKGPLNYIYAVDKTYAERTEKDIKAISIFDPDLNIKWPIKKQEMHLSKRDKKALFLKDLYLKKPKS